MARACGFTGGGAGCSEGHALRTYPSGRSLLGCQVCNAMLAAGTRGYCMPCFAGASSLGLPQLQETHMHSWTIASPADWCRPVQMAMIEDCCPSWPLTIMSSLSLCHRHICRPCSSS